MKKFNNKQGKKEFDSFLNGYDALQPDGEGEVNDFISLKGMKDLFMSSYALKADPYAATLPTSSKYPFLNKHNRMIGSFYGGDSNIDGGNVQQYANSKSSKFLKFFDYMRANVKINYRMLPILQSDKRGKALIDEMRKSIAESVSILQSTTFTNMAINNYAIETDLNMGSATTTNIANGDTEIQAYTSTTDVIYAMSIYYQIYFQECLSTMNAFNGFKMKQETMLMNAYNREVPTLNSLFGLFNRSSFTTLLNSINLSFEGEYIDKSFAEQVNIFNLIPSRRSNSMTSPVLELGATFEHPTKFKIYILNDQGKIVDINDTPFFDDTMLGLEISFNNNQRRVSIWEACATLKDMLSAQQTALYARQNLVPETVIYSDNARYNQVKELFDVLVFSMTIFKPNFSDYREALDVMTRTGTINWAKGMIPKVTSKTDGKMFQNKIVDDVFNQIFAGAVSLNYNENTKRWETFSLWNEYYGIPEYDRRNGGCFLTFASKILPESETPTEQIDYLPILYAPAASADHDNNIAALMTSRDGKQAVITVKPVTMNDNVVYSRLVPLLSQSLLQIRVPTVELAYNADLTDEHLSCLYKQLTSTLGLCAINKGEDVYDYSIDPDILAVYQIEISDITNIAITYARANAPFRGTSSSDDVLGFRVAYEFD